MSGQLPPIDQDLRAHLAHRSAGRLPEDLADQVLQAVDAAPVKPRRTWRAFGPRRALAVPRALLAGAALAAVVLLVAALAVVPRFQMTPAASGLAGWPSGYPIDRALTTDELGRLLDSGALKTYDTVLVDNPSVSPSTSCPKIDARYPVDETATMTIDGLDPQVCLYSATSHGMTPGKMVLRMLGERMLGYMATITAPPPSRRLAYASSDIWPQGWFLVHGWLDTDARDCGPTAVTSGAVKNPMLPIGYGTMCHAALTATKFDPGAATRSGPTPAGPPRILSFDVPNDGRPVDSAPFFTVAGGDPQTGSIEGTYLVFGQLQCSTYSSTDCEQSIVLARLTDVALPGPTPLPTGTPGAPATPLSPSLTGIIGTGNQPLSVDELETLMVTQPDHLAGRTVIAKAPIPTQISCQTDANGGGCAVNTAPLAETGDWAVSIGADGTLSLTGQVSTPATGGYVFTLQQLQAKSGGPGTGLAIVDAWLDWETRCDTLPTEPPDHVCHFSLLFPDKPKWMHMTPDSTAQYVKPDNAYLLYGSQASYGEAIHGLYLMRVETGSTLTMLARLETETPSAAPVTTTPATPMATPVASPGGSEVAPTALIGEGNRPLTVAEFAAFWAADPAHLAGRIAIVKGPVPTGFECSGVGPTGSSATSPRPCYANVVDGQVAPEGYWAVRVGSDGMLSVAGELSTPGSKFVVSLEEAGAVWKAPGSDKEFVLVDALIGGMGADACDVVGSPCPVGGGPAIHSVFLVEWVPETTDCGTGQDTGSGKCSGHAEVVARVETVAVP